jgi:hypothetical protein
MKQPFIVAIALLLTSLVSFSQELKPFVPSAKFLAENPSFTKDSTYSLNFDLVKEKQKWEGARQPVTSALYDLKQQHFNYSLLANKHTYYISYHHVLARPLFEYQVDPYHNDISRFQWYKQDTVIFNKALSWLSQYENIRLLELNSLLPASAENNPVFLTITVEHGLWSKNYKGDLPAYAIFTMHALNRQHDTLGTYKQIAFAEATNMKPGYFKFEALTLNQALKTLLAKFANDDKVQQALNDELKFPLTAKQLASTTLLNEVRQIEEKKKIIISVLSLDYDMEAYAERLKDNNNLKNTVSTITAQLPGSSASVSPTTEAISAAVGKSFSLLGGMLEQSYVKKELAEVKRIVRIYQGLQEKQALAIAQLLADNVIDKEAFQNKYNNDEGVIEGIEASIKRGAQAAKTEMAANQRLVDERITQKLAASTSSNAAGSEKSAISSSANGDCAAIAKAEWAKSQEAITYKQYPTNANASDSKAKLIELTLLHCKTKLPASEIAALQQAAAKERATARELRASAPK